MSVSVREKPWLLAEAKNRFSEVVRRVFAIGPQKITRRGGDVVVISETEYQLLKGHKVSFKDFLLQSTNYNLQDLDLRRDRSPMRELDL